MLVITSALRCSPGTVTYHCLDICLSCDLDDGRVNRARVGLPSLMSRRKQGVVWEDYGCAGGKLRGKGREDGRISANDARYQAVSDARPRQSETKSGKETRALHSEHLQDAMNETERNCTREGKRKRNGLERAGTSTYMSNDAAWHSDGNSILMSFSKPRHSHLQPPPNFQYWAPCFCSVGRRSEKLKSGHWLEHTERRCGDAPCESRAC